tara:strand:+ start:9536 stop:10180 length:645 start_codon:yes stop_codon:yes gene_type:complete
MSKLLLILLSSFVLFSCNEEKTETKQVSITEETQEGCIYSVNPKKLKFEWAAFKTTEKIRVNGTFNKIELLNKKAEESIPELLLDTRFIIHLNSLNSANKIRDKKIIDLFFGNLTNKAEFLGYIKDVKGDNKKGEALVVLEINGMKELVNMKYKMKNAHLKLAGDLDLLEWKTRDSFEAINTACKELHTGKDGVSKTWTDINIIISTVLNKDCK